MALTISVLSQKGGTGKTTAVRHIVEAFRMSGLRVLAIDLDPQGNLSDYFDIDPEADPTIGDVLTGRCTAAEAIHDSVIPANLSLAEAEITLAGRIGRELTLRKAIAEVREDYDVVVIDCPPALGLLTVNALVAADQALLSSEAQYFALQGVEQALEVIELARDTLNPELQWLGVLFNISDMRTVHSREAYEALGEHVGDRLLAHTVRQSIAYAESAERAVPIFEYRPDLGVDYLLVAEELLTRLGLSEQAARIAAMIPAPAEDAEPPAASMPEPPAEPAPEVPAEPAPETPREPEAPAAVNGHAATAAPAEGAFRFRAR
ncbi:MAG: ParA family protein [Solirubrobacteraceae bacterium]|nr:ParA family protein [Solirubrobacteraceae bacterium]